MVVNVLYHQKMGHHPTMRTTICHEFVQTYGVLVLQWASSKRFEEMDVFVGSFATRPTLNRTSLWNNVSVVFSAAGVVSIAVVRVMIYH